MTEPIPGYGGEIKTDADRVAFHEEAKRRGHHYALFVDGVVYKDPEKQKVGQIFQAYSLDEAKRLAYEHACQLSNALDYPEDMPEWMRGRTSIPGTEVAARLVGILNGTIEVEELPARPQYPTHAYKLYHQGKLIVDYVPPSSPDEATGKQSVC